MKHLFGRCRRCDSTCSTFCCSSGSCRATCIIEAAKGWYWGTKDKSPLGPWWVCCLLLLVWNFLKKKAFHIEGARLRQGALKVVCMESPTDFARPLWWHRGTTEIMKWTYNSSLRTSTSLRTAARIALHHVLQLCWHSKYHQITSDSIRCQHLNSHSHQLPEAGFVVPWNWVGRMRRKSSITWMMALTVSFVVIHLLGNVLLMLKSLAMKTIGKRGNLADVERLPSIFVFFCGWHCWWVNHAFLKRYVMEALADAIALVENSNGGKLKPSKMFKRLELWQKSMYQSRPPESTWPGIRNWTYSPMSFSVSGYMWMSWINLLAPRTLTMMVTWVFQTSEVHVRSSRFQTAVPFLNSPTTWGFIHVRLTCLMSFVSVKGADLHALFSLLDKDDRGAVDIGEFTRNYQADEHQNNECVSCGSWLRIGYFVSCLPHFWICLVVYGCLLYHHIMAMLEIIDILNLAEVHQGSLLDSMMRPIKSVRHESFWKFSQWFVGWAARILPGETWRWHWIWRSSTGGFLQVFQIWSLLMVPITHLKGF